MTHHPIKVDADGTRRYAGSHSYRPKPDEERVYARRKPDVEGAQRFGSDWYLPLPVLAEDLRVMPLTRPDEQTLEHKAICRCEVCSRPQAQKIWDRKLKRGWIRP